jgi:hypothetical protein
MINPSTFFIFVIPAVGVCFAAFLFVITAVADRRALERADKLERSAEVGG